MDKGKLTIFCGKMGAGKSTYAKSLAQQTNTIMLSEDEWLSRLFPGEVNNLNDYVRLSRRIKPLLNTLILDLLSNHIHVVLDFPGNTVMQRKWFKELINDAGVAHELIYIDLDDSECLKRIEKRRRKQPDRNLTDTPEMFRRVTSFFEPPTEQEGFTILVTNNASETK